jgi:hypothetical protein
MRNPRCGWRCLPYSDYDKALTTLFCRVWLLSLLHFG